MTDTPNRFGFQQQDSSGEETALYPKAPLGRRIAALAIDLGIVVVAIAVIVIPNIDSVALEQVQAGERTPESLAEEMMTPSLLVVMMMGQMFLVIRDGLRGGRGVGKGIMGLMVVRRGEPCSILWSVVRNHVVLLDDILAMVVAVGVASQVVSILLTAEVALILFAPTGRRLGDRVAETQVVEIAVLKEDGSFFEDSEDDE